MENNNWYSGMGSSFASSSDECCFTLPWPPLQQASTSNGFRFDGFSSLSTPVEDGGEDGGARASKSHSLAEKRRRDRINAQLTTLRKLIPKSDKMDKAALLASVIDHVKDLKRKAIEANKMATIPTDDDEVIIDCEIGEFDKSMKKIYIKASICCDDRPELLPEIIRVIKGQRLRAVKAEMACVGGRIKTIFILSAVDGGESMCLNTLRHSLESVLTRIAFSSLQSSHRMRSKRQKFFLQ